MPTTQPKVITVRLSVAQYKELKIEAHERRMSLNELCAKKLAQPYLDGPVIQAENVNGSDDRLEAQGCPQEPQARVV